MSNCKGPRTLVAVTITSLIVGCGTAAPTNPPPPERPAGNPVQETVTKPPETPDPSLVQPTAESTATEVPDLSLTVDEYLKLGIPSIEKRWSSSDLARAAKVLSDVAARDAAQLPRYGSPQSGNVFARMTSEQNLEQLQNKLFPVPVRIGFALQFLHSATTLSKLYASAALQKKTDSEESAELLGFTLRTGVELKELSKEAASRFDATDPKSADNQKNMKQMTSGLGPVLQAMFARAMESRTLSPEARTRMLTSIDETLPTLMPVLSPEVRTQLQKQLQAIRDNPDYDEHKDVLEPLLDKISKTIEDAGTNESDPR
jgi:hypothetical protein